MLWTTATRILEDWETFEAFVAQGGLEPHLGRA
jgi:hypothetical protein